MKLFFTQLYLVFGIFLANLAQASVENFNLYLRHHNSLNRTEIKYDTWYRISSLVKNRENLVALLEAAQKENINLIIEDAEGEGSLGNTRFLTRTKVIYNFGRPGYTYLSYSWLYGINYMKSPQNFMSYRAYGDSKVALNSDILNKVMFLIPSDTKLQYDFRRSYDYFEDLAKLISRYPQPASK